MHRPCLAFIAACLAVCAPAGASARDTASDPPVLQPVECPVAIPADLTDRIRCGTVSVPRDYARPAAGSFDLMVLVGRAATPKPDAPPVFVDYGGWSASNLPVGPTEIRFRAISNDVVLVDKRGAGFSTPQVCPPTMLQAHIGAIAADQPLESTLAAMRAALRDCREDMRRRRIDPAWFGVRISSRDLDRVRRALGHDRIRLNGTSNGGRQVLDYVAAYPQHVAAAVVDSPALPDAFLNRPSANFDRALDLVFAACSAQETCAARFPDLPALYRAAIEGLDREGLAIPSTEVPGGFVTINGADFELMLQQMLYAREAIALVPGAIAAAAAREAAALAPVIANVQRVALANGEITGSIFECRERPSLQNAPPVTRGSDIVGNLDGVCAFWSKPGEPSRLPENAPVPVLLLSGRFDPVTPPSYARRAAEAIGGSARMVEMQHSGHGAQTSMCVGLRMIPAFFEDPAAELVDCSASEKPIAFKVPPQG